MRRLTGEGTGSRSVAERGHLGRIFVDAANWPAAAPFSENDFKRLDENDDAQFYPAQQPRLVYHIDEGAVAALTAYYKREIKPGETSALTNLQQLGLALPAEPKARTRGRTGMNERELRANTQLTEFTPVWKSKFYGAIRIAGTSYAINATPGRWLGDERRLQPTHWLISTQVHATGP